MLKALGISGKSSKPARPESVKKYKDQQALRNQWRSDTQQLQAIISKLDQAYSAQKGDFALGRYEGLKNMIKESIKEYNTVIEASKNRSHEKYEAKAKSMVGGEQKQTGAINNLLHSAEAFSVHNDERQKDYTDMTSKEIEEDLTRFRREILQYKQYYREARDNLDRLAKQYEESKKFNPPQRYNELKLMIKDITRNYSAGQLGAGSGGGSIKK